MTTKISSLTVGWTPEQYASRPRKQCAFPCADCEERGYLQAVTQAIDVVSELVKRARMLEEEVDGPDAGESLEVINANSLLIEWEELLDA